MTTTEQVKETVASFVRAGDTNDVTLLDEVLHTHFQNVQDGFVKIFARKGSHTIVGGVVVSPRASELIFPIALAVANRLNVDQFSSTFTVYPSMSGSLSEAARQLHEIAD